MFIYKNTSYYIWNALVTLCTSFIAIFLPLKLVFSLGPSVFLASVYWFTSIILFLDFIIQIRRLKSNNYLSGWLLIDLIAAIPFGIMGGLSYWHLVKLIKLLRIGQYLHKIKEVEIHYAQILSIFYLLFWSTHIAHWISCGWLAIVGVDSSLGIQSNYISSLYWVITTLTTVGYGDIVPISDFQRIYSIFVQLAGLVFFGYIIGHVVSLLSKKDPEKIKYLENIDQMTSVLQSRPIPKELQKRILDYYGYLKDKNMGHDESSFLESLPEGLRMEVELVLKKELIEKIPLFQNVRKEFITECALQLEQVISPPDEYLIRAEEIGIDMYFIMSGELHVINKQGEVISLLHGGDFFGETALFTDKPRNASVVSVNFCHLYRLTKKTFKTIQSKYPEVAMQIEAQAKSRESQL